MRALLRRKHPRRLLVLAAYSALHDRIDALAQEQADLGVVGGPSVEERAEAMRDRIARFEEATEIIVPHDLGMVVSAPLLNEFERKLTEVQRMAPAPYPPDIAQLGRLAISALATEAAPAFDSAAIPRYVAADRDDDVVVHTAVLGGADFLVSEDHHLVALNQRREVSYGGRTVTVVHIGRFIRDHVDGACFDLSDIDPDSIRLLVEPHLPVPPLSDPSTGGATSEP